MPSTGFVSIEAPIESYRIGDALRYMCDTNFGTRDETETVCNAGFVWSLDLNPPVCTRGK